MKQLFTYVTYTEFWQQHPKETDFFDLIYEVKYPNNILRCPKCDRITKICRQKYDPRKMYCYAESCHREFSVLSDTMFKGTHLDLRIWFYAISLMVRTYPKPSALFLQKATGIKSYHSAHRMRSIINQTLIQLAQSKNSVDYKIISRFLHNEERAKFQSL